MGSFTAMHKAAGHLTANESHGAVGSTPVLGPDLGFRLHLNNSYF